MEYSQSASLLTEAAKFLREGGWDDGKPRSVCFKAAIDTIIRAKADEAFKGVDLKKDWEIGATFWKQWHNNESWARRALKEEVRLVYGLWPAVGVNVWLDTIAESPAEIFYLVERTAGHIRSGWDIIALGNS